MSVFIFPVQQCNLRVLGSKLESLEEKIGATSLFLYLSVEMANLDYHKQEGRQETSLITIVSELGKKYAIVSPLTLK